MALKRILLVDDHALVREGFRVLVESDSSLVVVAEATDGRAAISLMRTCYPDLLLVDINMEGVDGIEVINAAGRLCPDAKIVALTSHTEATFVRATLLAGADGYIVKTEDSDTILKAIHLVLDGKSYLSPDITGEVVSGYIRGVDNYQDGTYQNLTPESVS